MLLYNYGNTLIYMYLDLQSDTINYPYTYSLILVVQPTLRYPMYPSLDTPKCTLSLVDVVARGKKLEVARLLKQGG